LFTLHVEELRALSISYRFTNSSPRFHLACIAPFHGFALSGLDRRQSQRQQSKIKKGQNLMATIFKAATAALAIVLMGTACLPLAEAQCGFNDLTKPGVSVKPQSWQGQSEFGAPSILQISDRDSDHDSDRDSIVGMWKVVFTAKGNTGSGAPPDGVPIDSALVVWHSDKTEIMNSGRPPQDGDFCLGVWEKTGKSRYRLNHFAWGGNDTSNAPTGIGNPAGPTRFVENVVLSPDGNSYTGRFTLDAYDTSGTHVVRIIGVITATRITVNTHVSDIL
jgi:hypothetical protein